MIQFIKNALSEFEHVVWPTPNESKKYMIYTVSVIIIMASLLAVLGYMIRGGLTNMRAQFDHTPIVNNTVSGEDLATEDDLKKLQEQIQLRRASQTGTTGTNSPENTTPPQDTSGNTGMIVLPQ